MARACLDFPDAAPQVIDGEHKLSDFARVIPLPGHSLGLQGLLLPDGERTVLLAGQAVDEASQFATALLRVNIDTVDPRDDVEYPSWMPAWLPSLLDEAVFAHDTALWRRPALPQYPGQSPGFGPTSNLSSSPEWNTDETPSQSTADHRLPARLLQLSSTLQQPGSCCPRDRPRGIAGRRWTRGGDDSTARAVAWPPRVIWIWNEMPRSWVALLCSSPSGMSPRLEHGDDREEQVGACRDGPRVQQIGTGLLQRHGIATWAAVAVGVHYTGPE